MRSGGGGEGLKYTQILSLSHRNRKVIFRKFLSKKSNPIKDILCEGKLKNMFVPSIASKFEL